MHYTLTCTYSIRGTIGMDYELDASIYKAVGPSQDRGSGFGVRDHSWTNLTKDQADTKAKALALLDARLMVAIERG